MKGGEKVGYNVDLTAVLRANKNDTRSRSVDFPAVSNTSERNYSFRDSLKDAVGVRRQQERESEGSEYLRKELVGRAETKLRNIKEQQPESNDKLDSANKADKEKQNKLKKSLEELLSKLEEMYKTQQPNEIAVQNEKAVTEDIEKILNELKTMQSSPAEITSPAAQLKLTELTSKLEGMLKELNSKADLTNKQEISDFTKELESIIAETKTVVEAAPKAQTTDNAAETGKAAEKSFNGGIPQNELEASENNKLQVKDSVLNSEDKPKLEEEGNQTQIVRTEAVTTVAKPAGRDVQPVEEELSEQAKAAVDSKIDKVTVEGKESSKQEAEGGKEAEHQAQQLPKAAAQNKQVNEEMAAVRLEQTKFDNQIEVVLNKIPVQKPETVNKAEVINQIVKKAEVILSDAKQEMRIQLEPENLGKLTLKLAVEKGLITAKFEAESHEVKQVIESSFNELKDLLQEKGLEVQNFSVSVGQENNGYNNSNAFQQWKETVRLNGRSMNKASYDGYQTDTVVAERAINPYSMHDGKFDSRA